jgi:hypothetical protein
LGVAAERFFSSFELFLFGNTVTKKIIPLAFSYLRYHLLDGVESI